MSASTGASFGRYGGRSGSGSRLRASLDKAVRVRVLEAPETSQRKKRAHTHREPAVDDLVRLAEQASAAATAAAEAAQAAIAAAAAAGGTVSSSQAVRTGQKEQRAAAHAALKPRANGAAGTKHKPGAHAQVASKSRKLSDGKRGARVIVVPRATYGARKTYTFEDVCTQGAQIASGKMSLNASDSVDENGDRIYPVPKATMARWMKDDADVMKGKGGRGVSGQPHWKVEREVRKRVSLSKPGGVKGGGTLLGAAEDVLCTTLARAAQVTRCLGGRVV